jgi:dTDP-4-amino-4,6-dideoxygalactose transaminase
MAEYKIYFKESIEKDFRTIPKKDLQKIILSNMLTNVNDYTARFEDAIKDLTGSRNVIAVSP